MWWGVEYGEFGGGPVLMAVDAMVLTVSLVIVLVAKFTEFNTCCYL